MDITKRELADTLELISVFTYELPQKNADHYRITERLVDRHKEIEGEAFLTLKSALGEVHRHFVQAHLAIIRSLSLSKWSAFKHRDDIALSKKATNIGLHAFTERHVALSVIPDEMRIPGLITRQTPLYVLLCNNPVRDLSVTLSQATLFSVELSDYDDSTNEALLSYETSHGKMIPLYDAGGSAEIKTHELYKRWFTNLDVARETARQLCENTGINEVLSENATS